VGEWLLSEGTMAKVAETWHCSGWMAQAAVNDWEACL